jgi:hypothetical protein
MPPTATAKLIGTTFRHETRQCPTERLDPNGQYPPSKVQGANSRESMRK